MSGLKFDAREPCTSCPYRKDAPLRLWSPSEFRQLLRTEQSQLGTLYGCHEYNKRPEDAQVCVGWLLDQRGRGCPSIMLRIRLSRDEVARQCLTEAASPVPLFPSVKAMCRANGVRRA